MYTLFSISIVTMPYSRIFLLLSFKMMNKISHEHSAQIRAAYQLSNVRGKKLLQMSPQYSKAAIYKHAKKPLNGEPVFDKRIMNKGRPKKLSIQDERSIIRTIPKLREELGNFTSKRVQLESGVTHVSNRTIRNILNKEGYHYLRSRKKGLLHAGDLKARKKAFHCIWTVKVLNTRVIHMIKHLVLDNGENVGRD